MPELIEYFRSGDFDLHDQLHLSQLKKLEDEELQNLLNENTAQTQQEHAEKLGISQKAIVYII